MTRVIAFIARCPNGHLPTQEFTPERLRVLWTRASYAFRASPATNIGTPHGRRWRLRARNLTERGDDGSRSRQRFLEQLLATTESRRPLSRPSYS